jgi:hypothetical protein
VTGKRKKIEEKRGGEWRKENLKRKEDKKKTKRVRGKERNKEEKVGKKI